jgi:excinuclease UvrABC nuclease subunit
VINFNQNSLFFYDYLPLVLCQKQPWISRLEHYPSQPGVYQYFDADDRLIYVGKAKDIKKAGQQLFYQASRVTARPRVLVKNINFHKAYCCRDRK